MANLKLKSSDWFQNQTQQPLTPTVNVSSTSTYAIKVEVFDNKIKAEFAASIEFASWNFVLPFAIQVLDAKFLSSNSVANGELELKQTAGVIATFVDATTVSTTYEETLLSWDTVNVAAGSSLIIVCMSTAMAGVLTINYLPQTTTALSTAYGTAVTITS